MKYGHIIYKYTMYEKQDTNLAIYQCINKAIYQENNVSKT